MDTIQYDYLIIGGGMAADAAVRGIREVDNEGTIGICTDETDPPYARPPLSKDLWGGDKQVEDILLKTEELGVEIHKQCPIEEIDVPSRKAMGPNTAFAYKRLLLSTGGTPKKLPFDAEEIIYFRTLADYRRLAELAENKSRFAVIGGGFIGCEIAAALAKKNKEVTFIFPEQYPGAGRFPEAVAQELESLFEYRHVDLKPGLKPVAAEPNGDEWRLRLEDGQSLQVEAMVAGLGIEPNIELARAAGLDTNDGIPVDAEMKTSADDIYAAGDVARFYCPILNQAIRVEHEENAVASGRIAGRNMAGQDDAYEHLPMFYSDLFDVGYEAVGETHASMDAIGVWEDIHEPGIWAYSRDNRVAGVLLWNLFGKTDAARILIGSDDPFTHDTLKRKLQDILQS